MLGRDLLARPTVEGVLTGPIFNSDGRRVYARVEVERRDGTWFASPTGPQGSQHTDILVPGERFSDLPGWTYRAKRPGRPSKSSCWDWNEEVAQ